MNNDEISDNEAIGCACLIIFLFIIFLAVIIQNIILY